jgi:hypothetical protein
VDTVAVVQFGYRKIFSWVPLIITSPETEFQQEDEATAKEKLRRIAKNLLCSG